MIFIFLTFILALALGYSVLYRFTFVVDEKLLSLFSLLLIGLFGYQLTALPESAISISFFGKALALSFASLAGSVLFSIPLLLFLKKINTESPTAVEEEHAEVRNTSCIYIGIALLTLLLGMAIGVVYKGFSVDGFVQIVLHCMVFAIGLHIALRVRLEKNKKQKVFYTFSVEHVIYLFGVPTSVILGTLIGSSLTGMLIGIGWRDGALCGAPLGWQTLGGPVVQEFRGVSLGSFAFIVNMFRDCLSLVLIPFIAMSKLPLLTITPGGVSSMDILLPAIIKTTGKRAFIPAVWIGACCSFWAPVLLFVLNQLDS